MSDPDLLPLWLRVSTDSAEQTRAFAAALAPAARALVISPELRMPPSAMMGTSTFERTSGSSTMVETSRGFLKPPPSPPSTTRPSTPHSTAFNAAERLGTT